MSADEMSELSQLQRWFQHVMTHAGSVAEGVRSSGALAFGVSDPAQVEALVRPSTRQSPVERIGVYHFAYKARLIECLADDYPALRALRGAESFAALCRDYIARYVPRSASLNDYGAHMAGLCRAQAGHRAPLEHDLARVEWAEVELIHEPQALPLTAADFSAQQSQWHTARLCAVPALRLLQLDHPVLELQRALRRGEPHSIPVAEEAYVVLYRQGWTIMNIGISCAEGQVLQALLSGTPLGQALELALTVGATDVDVAAWFQRWTTCGFFCAFEA